MSEIVIAAIAFMLVIEGILPLTAPRAWRQVFQQMLEMTDGQLRFIGLMSMLLGLALLFVFR